MSTSAEADQLHAAMNDLTAAANLPADTTGQPGRFRTATLVWACLTAACVALAFTGDTGLILGAVFGFMCLVCTLAFVSLDLAVPAARDRNTSTKAVLSYFRGIAKGRWDTAFAALSPMARERDVTVPSIDELQTVPTHGPLATKKHLKTYWRTIIKPSGARSRRLSKTKVVQVASDDNVHRHRVDLHIEHYPSWIAITVLLGVIPAVLMILAVRKTYKTSFEVITFKYKSQWWLLTGEFASVAEGNPPDAKPLPVARVVT